MGTVNAIMCPSDNIDSPTGCVCGHSPNSALGYGQVIIGGATPSIISCNNMDDGVCPEDFTDPITNLSANCDSCPDPDCTVNDSSNNGYVWGYVNDSENKRLENVIVTGHPNKWNGSASLDRSTITDSWGEYNFTSVISGYYYFSASKKGYTTQLLEAKVNRGQITRLDFQLLNGSCAPDCTNSYNRCDATCDGATFNGGSMNCTFYNSTIRDACNNKLKGTNISLEGYLTAPENYSYFVECCKSAPVLERYVKAKPDVVSTWITDLIKTEKIARLDEKPVRVVISYWPSSQK